MGKVWDVRRLITNDRSMDSAGINQPRDMQRGSQARCETRGQQFSDESEFMRLASDGADVGFSCAARLIDDSPVERILGIVVARRGRVAGWHQRVDQSFVFRIERLAA